MGIADAAGAGKDHVADRISDALLAAAVMWRGFSRDNGLLVVAGALLATSFAPAMMKQLALRADIPAAGLPKLAIGSRVVRFAFVAVALALPVLGVANGSVHVQALLFAVAGILGDITALARLRVALTRTGGIRPFLKDVTRSREMSSSLQPGEISDSHKKMAVVVAVSIPLIPIFLRLLAK
jgi:phosphatidylglycerophosphate synthase